MAACYTRSAHVTLINPIVVVVYNAGQTPLWLPYFNISLVSTYTACYYNSQIHIDQGDSPSAQDVK